MRQLPGCECMMVKYAITSVNIGYFERLPFFFYPFEVTAMVSMKDESEGLQHY